MVTACKKKKDSDPQPQQPAAFAYSQAKLEKRWAVANNNRVAGTSSSTLIAVEFVGNAYVLYFPNDSIVTGTYITFDANYLILNGFGTLQINTLTDTDFGFTLIVNGTQQKFTSAKATQTIADSDATAKICRTWKLMEYTIMGTTQADGNSMVTFNKYGTYLTREMNQLGVTEVSTNTWMWSNTAEDEICYGAWDGGNITSCDGLGHVSLTFSEDGKKLIMVETDNDFGTITYKLELL